MSATERRRSWGEALAGAADTGGLRRLGGAFRVPARYHGAVIRIRDAARSLYAARQRSALALIGIVLGIGSVIAMISVGMSAKVEALGQFRELGTDILTVTRVGRPNPRTRIRLEHAGGLVSEVPSIVAAAPWIRSNGEFSHAGKPVGDGPILGVGASFPDLNKLRLAGGRFISDLDFRRYYCVVGAGVARAMRRAGVEQVVGESIKLMGRVFTVVGEERPVTALGLRTYNADGAVYLPITTAQRIFGNAEIRDVIARLGPDADHLAAAAEVRAYFRGKSPDLDVQVQTARQLIEQMQRQSRLFTLLLGAVGAISLIVGGVGVMNVMLSSVTERRREIGIRRALGARRRDIQNQFLTESVILSLVGGVVGIALGIGVSYGICSIAGWPFLVSPMAVVFGVGMASGVGVFFGFLPAYQAARLDPIAALRAV